MAAEHAIRWNKPSGVRKAARRLVTEPARLTWKDASGAVRFASVRIWNLSTSGMFVECVGAVALARYRLVHVQLENAVRNRSEFPVQLREGRILAAVWRVGPFESSTGTPSGYALRFLTDPHAIGTASRFETTIAVAS